MMEPQVSSRIQNTLLNNRVKILKLCDYFIVSAPLIAKRILPMETHKEIRKTASGILDAKAANTARMDSLLDFIDEVPNPMVFDTFLEGVKNCEASKQFAKLLKKEAEGGNGGVKLPPKLKSPKPKVSLGKPRPPPPTVPASSTFPFQNNSIFGGGGAVTGNGPISLPLTFSFANPATFTSAHMLHNLGTEVSRPPGALPPTPPSGLVKKKAATKRPKKLENGPPKGPGGVGGTGSDPTADVFAFNPNAANPPVPVPKPRTPRPTKKSNTPKSTPGGQKTAGAATPTGKAGTPSVVKKEKKPVAKKVYPSKVKSTKPATKVVTPGPSLTATLVYKKTEAGPSTSGATTPTPKVKAEGEGKGDGVKVFSTTVPAGSPFRPKNKGAKSQQPVKQMTFQEAEDKQRTAIRATGFTFTNPQAVVKKIFYNDKSDLFYEGCPTKEGNYLCTKKVQLKGKGKKYVCKEKHENEDYQLFPRLVVTFEDSTASMDTTIYRENVEILAGKSVTEMHSMNDAALSNEFAKAIGMNIPIRVAAEKVLKKDLKISGGKTWNNVAHVMNDAEVQSSGPPAAKKAKKAPSTD